MMLELGKYAGAVLWSYGASVGLLAALVWMSWRRSARVRAELERIEGRRNGTD